jgi:hypothetical protein
MDDLLCVALRRNITARAHLASAEAAELMAEANNPPEGHPDPEPFQVTLKARAAAARRRYWRDVAAVQALMGTPWPEAEALGVET